MLNKHFNRGKCTVLTLKGKSQYILALCDTRYSTQWAQTVGCTNNLPNSQAQGNMELFFSLYHLPIKGSEPGSEPGIHKPPTLCE